MNSPTKAKKLRSPENERQLTGMQPRTERVTVTSIAESLGLSPSTVSFVLSGNRRRISDSTAEKVLAEAQRLNYVPNRMAQTLKYQRSGIIGVVLADFSSAWGQRILDGIDRVLQPEKLVVFATYHKWDASREEDVVRILLERCVDGLLICVPMPQNCELYSRVHNQGIPIVFLGETIPGCEQIPCVAWDGPTAGGRAARHLIELGRKRLGFLSVHFGGPMIHARFDGFRDAIKQAGLPISRRGIYGPYPEANPALDGTSTLPEVMHAMFDDRNGHPDGLVVISDFTGMMVQEHLLRMGYRVPEDVALVGLGDMPESSYPAISLTTVIEPLNEMGASAARALLSLIDRKPVSRLELVVSDQLIERHSSNPQIDRLGS